GGANQLGKMFSVNLAADLLESDGERLRQGGGFCDSLLDRHQPACQVLVRFPRLRRSHPIMARPYDGCDEQRAASQADCEPAEASQVSERAWINDRTAMDEPQPYKRYQACSYACEPDDLASTGPQAGLSGSYRNVGRGHHNVSARLNLLPDGSSRKDRCE